MKKVRGTLSYANVVATLALFLVLTGGAAYAAAKLGANSVGTKQLKNGAVTQAKISSAAQTALKGAQGPKGETGSEGKVGPQGKEGQKGEKGDQGEPGPSTGAAGGDLTGNYPNPSIAPGAVTTADFAAGAIAPEATKLGGEEASAFFPAADAKRIQFLPDECVTAATTGCTATILQMAGETVKGVCGTNNAGQNQIKIEAEGNDEVDSTNAAFIGSAGGGTPHAGGFGASGTVVVSTGQEETQVGTVIVAADGYTITISLQVYSGSTGPTSFCQVNGTAVMATA